MKTNLIKYDILTPKGPVLSGNCEIAVLPEPAGEIGIMKSHTPLLAALGTGVMKFKSEGTEKKVFIANGFLEVLNNKIVILAEIAERAEEIDVERAKKSLDRANERLNISSPNRVIKPEDRLRARHSKDRASARLKTAGFVSSASEH